MTRNWKSLAVAALLLSTPAAVSAQGTASVTVDGQLVAFDQPPIVEQGRVLVPLRGVFERLGATVVYDAATRQVQATSRTGTAVSLRLGSTQATIGGRSYLMDVPARSVGGRTLVPLRFVAEAMGAQVEWQPARRNVAITPSTSTPPVAVTPPRSAVIVSTVVPAAGSIVGNNPQPTIRATYADAIDPSTARMTVDGNDVTSLANVSAHEVFWTPNYQLASGSHLARIDAVTTGGTPIRSDWSFVLNPGTVSGYLIDSIQVGPDRPIQRGESVLVTMQGVPRGRALMDVGGNKRIPMTEVRPGIYEGIYTVTARDQVDAYVVVHLEGPDGRVTSLQADERAALWGNPSLR